MGTRLQRTWVSTVMASGLSDRMCFSTSLTANEFVQTVEQLNMLLHVARQDSILLL